MTEDFSSLRYTANSNIEIHLVQTNVVQIRLENTASFKYVCTDHDSYSLVVQIVCQELGFSGGYGWTQIISDGPASIQIESCTGNEENVSECTISDENNCVNTGVTIS